MCNGHCTSYCSLTQSQPDITTPGWSAKIKQRDDRKKLFSLEWENQISGLSQKICTLDNQILQPVPNTK